MSGAVEPGTTGEAAGAGKTGGGANSPGGVGTAGAARSDTPRQPIVKAPGRVRRARLLPAPGTDPDPHPPVLREDGGVASVGSGRGANDDRLRQDRPPHW